MARTNNDNITRRVTGAVYTRPGVRDAQIRVALRSVGAWPICRQRPGEWSVSSHDRQLGDPFDKRVIASWQDEIRLAGLAPEEGAR